MRLEEIILKHLQELPGPEKVEVLNFIEYLQAKTEKKDRSDWTTFSLSSTMRDMGVEDTPYSLDDLKESFS
jgi:hypothetical protein